LPCTFF
jgi:hypothetical protein